MVLRMITVWKDDRHLKDDFDDGNNNVDDIDDDDDGPQNNHHHYHHGINVDDNNDDDDKDVDDKDVYDDNEEVDLILSGVLAHGPHHLKQLPGRYWSTAILVNIDIDKAILILAYQYIYY